MFAQQRNIYLPVQQTLFAWRGVAWRGVAVCFSVNYFCNGESWPRYRATSLNETQLCETKNTYLHDVSILLAIVKTHCICFTRNECKNNEISDNEVLCLDCSSRNKY